MILFSSTTGEQKLPLRVNGEFEKKGSSGMRALNQSLSHSALMMCDHTYRKAKAGSTVTGITDLSRGRCAAVLFGACCEIMVFILIRIMGKN